MNVEAITTPAALLSAADLRAHLRLNDTAEDSLLTEFVCAAQERFESDCQRPILATTYRQYLGQWPGSFEGWWKPGLGLNFTVGCPASAIVIGRGGVSSVTAVRRYLADGSDAAIANTVADLKTSPKRVLLASIPDRVTNSAGVAISPVGYVEFVAGWPDANAVPKAVRIAVKLLAAHWYRNREAYGNATAELPEGWRRICDLYRLRLTGEWGQ